jgi:hypothetical protein
VTERSYANQSQQRLKEFFSFFSKTSSEEKVVEDLLRELGKVRKEVVEEYQIFKKLSGAETCHRSNETVELVRVLQRKKLLCLFVQDLSNGVSGEVLASKSRRDSQLSVVGKMDRVPWKLKWVSWLFVVFLDGGMLLYVYLFAMNQTHSRQQAWFVSFVMWLGFEIFLSSTCLVLVLHLLIPLYVWSDVAKAKERVLCDLRQFREKYLEKKATEDDIETGSGECKRGADPREDAAGDVRDAPQEFNAAKYLFPSWRVACLFPELPESQLVIQFSTPWPKKKFGNEEGDVTKEYEDDVLSGAAWNILLYFLTSLLHYNSLVQDIIVQTVCNGGLGYLCVLLVQLWTIHPWLAVLVVLVLVLCLYCLERLLTKKLESNGATVRPDDEPSLPVAQPAEQQSMETSTLPPQNVVTAQDPNPGTTSDGDDDHLSVRFCLWESVDSSSSGVVQESVGSEEEEEEEEEEDVSSVSSSDLSIEVVVRVKHRRD